MLDYIFNSVLDGATTLSVENYLICTACSLILGGIIAFIYTRQGFGSKNFVVTLALLPAIIQMVIMLVNGNLGTGVAVMGAFGLVRFRSVPGNAREIGKIFLAMAVGLATGMGYLAVAVVFVILIETVNGLYMFFKLGEPRQTERILKITIPEGLDYTEVFDDLFQRFTAQAELLQVRTTNMGSLYKLDYRIVLINQNLEKAMIDELRCRNGNLEISSGRMAYGSGEL